MGFYVQYSKEVIATLELFEKRSIKSLASILEVKKYLIIDGAQKIPDIGGALKLMVDGQEHIIKQNFRS